MGHEPSEEVPGDSNFDDVNSSALRQSSATTAALGLPTDGHNIILSSVPFRCILVPFSQSRPKSVK